MRRSVTIGLILVASLALGMALGTIHNAFAGKGLHWCQSHTSPRCTPATTTTTTTVPVTTTTIPATTTTTTTVASTAYVTNCVPNPSAPTLEPAGYDFFPHVYDGTPTGAQAFVDAHPGACWQTYLGGTT